MGDDAITRDGPEYRDATASRHDHPPDFSTRVSDPEQLDVGIEHPVRPSRLPVRPAIARPAGALGGMALQSNSGVAEHPGLEPLIAEGAARVKPLH
jgi:hypothetical protein